MDRTDEFPGDDWASFDAQRQPIEQFWCDECHDALVEVEGDWCEACHIAEARGIFL